MNLTATIESAELKFKQILEEFFISVYDEKYLPSHGIEHHRRVWGYAKELLYIIEDQAVSDLTMFPSNLIVACYLHDIGMTLDPGPKHGKHSRELCSRFLKKNNLETSDFLEALFTIENHDRKEYLLSASDYDLITLLSVADDLDAFGITGIYRYSEIYLTRGINPAEIGYLIKENSERRFDNFIKTFGFRTEFADIHRERYIILNNFYTEYNKAVESYSFEKQPPRGFCGVIQIFIFLINNKILIKDFIPEPEKYEDDKIIVPFFDRLKSELTIMN